jgi:uncharacterized protein involved in exopolysaccharide biosynthesis
MRDDSLSHLRAARSSAHPQPHELETPGSPLAGFRNKWLLALALLAGMPCAYVASTYVPVTYTARGNLWLEAESRRTDDQAPDGTVGLPQSSAWIQLLRSFQVLEPVVLEHELHVRPPHEHAPAFASFALAEKFRPGTYELNVGAGGDTYGLTTAQGALVQQGVFGEPIGENVGFAWRPSKGSFPAGETVEFSVHSVREAARDLSNRLRARLDRKGNFLAVSLSGPEPQQIADVLNAIMERHVSLAAELKQKRLDQAVEILTEQLDTVELALARAERDLEEFRVSTISLPSARSGPREAGLLMTRDPVFQRYFEERIEVEQLARDRARLQTALDSFRDDPARTETLEVIEAATGSSELRSMLHALVEARSELRVLRDRYNDDYGPIQDLTIQITTLETVAIPRVIRGILDELEAREQEAQRYVDEAGAELQEVPPRIIEEGRLIRRVRTTENLYNEIRGRLDAARLAAASAVPDVSILDRAAVPRHPSEDMRLPIAALILFGFLGVAMAGGLLLDRMSVGFRVAPDMNHDPQLDAHGGPPRTPRRHRSTMRHFGEGWVPVLAIIGGSALGLVATGALWLLTPGGDAPQVIVPSATDRPGTPGEVRLQAVDGTLRQPRIAAVIGNGQIADVGELLPVRPTVAVVDEWNNPIPGVEVRFEVKSGDGVITPTRARTDSLGRASAGWRLGIEAGVQTISASVPGLVAVVTFTATARH